MSRFEGKIEIANTTYNLKPDFVVNNRKDIELDDFFGTIRNLKRSELDVFDSGQFIDLTINELDGDTTIQTETNRWFTTTIPSKLRNRSKRTYELTVTGVEYTKKLQNDIVIGKSFKQPLRIDEADPLTWRYTALDTLRRLVNDSVLYTGITSFDELDHFDGAIKVTGFPVTVVLDEIYNYNNIVYNANIPNSSEIVGFPHVVLENNWYEYLDSKYYMSFPNRKIITSFPAVLKQFNEYAGILYDATFPNAETITSFPYELIDSFYHYGDDIYRVTITGIVNDEAEFLASTSTTLVVFDSSTLLNSMSTTLTIRSFAELTDSSVDEQVAANEAEFLALTTEEYYEERDYIIIDAELEDLLSIRSADFVWRDKTLFECIVDIFNQIDAAPRLEYDYTFGNDVLKADLYNTKGANAPKNEDKTSESRQFDAANNITHMVTRFENVSDSSVNNVTFYPSNAEFVSMKSYDFFLQKNSQAYIPTGNKSISDLIDVVFNIDTLVQDKTKVTFTTQAGTKTLAQIDSNLAANQTVSCINNIKEYTEWDDLKTVVGTGNIGVNKANTLSFNRFKPDIGGLNYDDRGAFREDTDIVYNMITTSLSRDPDVLQALATTLGTSIGGLGFILITIDPSQTTALVMGQIGWRTKFISSDNLIVNTERLDDFRAADFPGRTYKKFVNQQDRGIDIEKASWYTLGIIERLGLSDNNIMKTHNSMSARHMVGDVDGIEVITVASYIYSNRQITAKYQYNKNFNKQSTRLALDSQVRTFNINEEQVDVLKNIKSYLVIDNVDSGSLNNTTLGKSFEIKSQFLSEFLHTRPVGSSIGDNELAFVYQAVRTGRTWDGVEKYSNTTTEGNDGLNNDGIGSVTFLAPTDVRVVGRSMIVNTKFITKSSAGKRVASNNDILPIPYVYLGEDQRYQGEFETANGTVGYGSENIVQDVNILPLLSASSSIGKNTSSFIPTDDTLFELTNLEIDKDRNENITQQMEIEVKAIKNSNTIPIVVYPGFLRSHKIMGGTASSGYKAARLVADTVITLGIRNLAQLRANIELGRPNVIQADDLTVTYNKTDMYLQVTNNVLPYVIYDVDSEDILLANNDPTQFSGNNNQSRMYLKLRATLLDILTASDVESFFVGNIDNIKTFSQQSSYDFAFDSHQESSPNDIGFYELKLNEFGPVIKKTSLHNIEFDMEYELGGDYGLGIDEQDIGTFTDGNLRTIPTIESEKLIPLTGGTNNINIKESMRLVNGGVQLLQDFADNEYTMSLDVSVELDVGTGNIPGLPDAEFILTYYRVDNDSDKLTILDHQFQTPIKPFTGSGTVDDGLVWGVSKVGEPSWIHNNDTNPYFKIGTFVGDSDSLEFDDIESSFTTMPFTYPIIDCTIDIDNQYYYIDGYNGYKTGFATFRSELPRGDQWLFDIFGSPLTTSFPPSDLYNYSFNETTTGTYNTKTLDINVSFADKKIYGSVMAIDTPNPGFGYLFKDPTVKAMNQTLSFRPISSQIERDVTFTLVRARSDYKIGDNAIIIDSQTFTSGGQESFNLSGTTPTFNTINDTLYLIYEIDGTTHLFQQVLSTDLTVTSNLEIDKQVFIELTNQDGTETYIPRSELVSNKTTFTANIDKNVTDIDPNDELRLNITGANLNLASSDYLKLYNSRLYIKEYK